MSDRLPPEQLDPGLCGAWNPKREKHCGSPAGAGTDHKGVGRCYKHGGRTPGQVVAAERQIAIAECQTLGISIATTAADALLDELAETKGNVAFYRSLVEQLPSHPTKPVRVEVDGGPEDGAVSWTPGVPGVYAPTFHQSGIATGEAKPHVLVQLYNDERKHYLAVSTAALKANVDERRIELAEQAAMAHGQEIAARFRRFIDALGLDLADSKVQAAARLALTQDTQDPIVDTTAQEAA